MKFLLKSVFVVSLSLAVGTVWAQSTPKAKERVIKVGQTKYLLKSKLKTVLNASFSYNFHHNSGRALIKTILDSLALKEGWTVTTIRDSTKITLAELQKHEVLIWNNISNMQSMTTPMKQAIRERIFTEGASSLAIHGSGDDGRASWRFYSDTLHPVGYEGHPYPWTTQKVYKPTVADSNPVVENIMNGGVKKDVRMEFYYNTKHITTTHPSAELLLQTDPLASLAAKYKLAQGNHISWVFPVGKGKHMYFPVGHGAEESNQHDINSFGKAEFDRFIYQALMYIGPYDSLKMGCMTVGNANYDPTAKAPDPAACSGVGNVYRTSENESVRFSPNHIAVMVTEPARVTLLDMVGRVVFERSSKDVMEYVFEESKLTQGVYFLQVKTAKSLTSKKYFINR